MSYYEGEEYIEKIFLKDIREKNKTKRGAFCRASRKKGFRGAMKTPYDFMTGKQRKMLNGEVITYMLNEQQDNVNENLNTNTVLENKPPIETSTLKPNIENTIENNTSNETKSINIISKYQFNLLPRAEKIRVLDELTDKYTRVQIASAWGTTRDNLYNYCYRYLPDKFNVDKNGRKSQFKNELPTPKDRIPRTKPLTQGLFTPEQLEQLKGLAIFQNQQNTIQPQIQNVTQVLNSEFTEEPKIFHLEFNKKTDGKSLKDRILSIISVLDDNTEYEINLIIEGE